VADKTRVLLFLDGYDALGLVDTFSSLDIDFEAWNRLRPETWGRNAHEFDVILIHGPHNGTMMEVARLLQSMPPRERPLLAWWLCENVINLSHPFWYSRVLSLFRWHLDRFFEKISWRPMPSGMPKRLQALNSGHRLRMLGELYYFRSRGLLDSLAVSCPHRTFLLNKLGFDAINVPLGYNETFGKDLGLERDIDVLFLGSLHSKRRRKIIRKVREDLQKYNINLTIYDGCEEYLSDRTHYLNRVKVLLNIVQSPGDWTSHRFLLGMANKALIVTEPVPDLGPYKRGHKRGHYLIETPIEEMAQKIDFYLKNDHERKKIVEKSYQFIRSELTMTRMCEQIIDNVITQQSHNYQRKKYAENNCNV
jgi:hypothetical protein